MPTFEQITAELQRQWTAAAPSEIPTQFAGVPLDSSRLESWFEFWITQCEEPKHRPVGRAISNVLIDVHCFARGRDKRLAARMADAVRGALRHQTFPILDGESAAGILRVREAAMHDLTRESDDEPRHPVQHLTVSLIATAEDQ